MVAEEILSACDELGSGGGGVTGADGQSGLANPAIHMLRGLRHRNLAAIRHAAQVSFSSFYFIFFLFFYFIFFYIFFFFLVVVVVREISIG